MPSKANVTIESDEKEVMEATARPATTIWHSLFEFAMMARRSRRVYSHSNDAAHRKCTMTDKAYNKRKARNKIAKMSRRANRRRK